MRLLAAPDRADDGVQHVVHHHAPARQIPHRGADLLAHVEVTLAVQGDALEVAVRDDGVGFDVDERLRTGLGLVGMGERAALANGHLAIESAPGAGTTLRARFPLPQSTTP